MRKKIIIGFASLIAVLLFAGIISIFELNRLRDKTALIIDSGAENARIADILIGALQTQNSAVIKMIISKEVSEPGPEYISSALLFEQTLAEAAGTINNPDDLIPIREDAEAYANTVLQYANESLEPDMVWFAGSYLTAYYKLDESITNFISSPGTSLADRAAMLERNAYKTITPSILTLLVAIIIVLMFFFFVDSYYVRPLQKINKGLRKYLSAKIPFDDSFETNDDLNELKKSVAELIEQSRKGR